ncbi:MAG TPA: hypothetical protein VLA89_05825, partial [Gemmatimonadales bacterium]|nr:hypothetical protein [Gemmatimonadales bacterium]
AIAPDLVSRLVSLKSRVRLVSRWNPRSQAWSADGRSYDLVATHYLHPPEGGMAAVTSRLAEAVAPGGHLLVVGHAPSEVFTQLTAT